MILRRAAARCDAWSIQPHFRQRSTKQVAKRHLARSVLPAVSAIYRPWISDLQWWAYFPRSLLRLNKLRINLCGNNLAFGFGVIEVVVMYYRLKTV